MTEIETASSIEEKGAPLLHGAHPSGTCETCAIRETLCHATWTSTVRGEIRGTVRLQQGRPTRIRRLALARRTVAAHLGAVSGAAASRVGGVHSTTTTVIDTMIRASVNEPGDHAVDHLQSAERGM